MLRSATFTLAGLALALTACSSDDSTSSEREQGRPTPERMLFSDRVLNIAHGGGKGPRPEHTMIAYANAVAEGTDVLELDIHATADGVLVAMHDETVDDTTDGTGAIKDMTFDELRQLDAAHHYSPDDGATHPYRGQGHTVPSLEEIFDAHPNIAYVIEIKQADPPIVKPFIELCRAKGMLDQMVASAFSSEVLAQIRAEEPNVPTSFGTDEVMDLVFMSPDRIDTYEPPGDFLQVPPEFGGLEVLNSAFMDRARTFDLKVHAWTINDETEMSELIELGVDGIITDYPARLNGVLGRDPGT